MGHRKTTRPWRVTGQAGNSDQRHRATFPTKLLAFNPRIEESGFCNSLELGAGFWTARQVGVSLIILSGTVRLLATWPVAVEKVTDLVLVGAVQERYKQRRVPDAVLDHHSRRLLLHDGTTHPIGVAVLLLPPGRSPP